MRVHIIDLRNCELNVESQDIEDRGLCNTKLPPTRLVLDTICAHQGEAAELSRRDPRLEVALLGVAFR